MIPLYSFSLCWREYSREVGKIQKIMRFLCMTSTVHKLNMAYVNFLGMHCRQWIQQSSVKGFFLPDLPY